MKVDLQNQTALVGIIRPYDDTRANKIEHCGNKDVKPCKDVLCKLCNARKQTRLAKNLHRDNQLLSTVINGLHFQTFVTVAIHDTEVKELKKMIEKLNKVTKMLWESNREVLNLIALYSAVEVAREGKLYKPHIHIIVTARADNDTDVYTALQSYLPLFYKTKIRSSHNVSVDIRPVTDIVGLEYYVNKGLYIDKNGNSIIGVDNWRYIDDILNSCDIICRYGYEDIDRIRPTVDMETKKNNIKQGIKNSSKKSGESRKGKKRDTPKKQFAKDFIFRNAKTFNPCSTYTNRQIIEALQDELDSFNPSTFYAYVKELREDLHKDNEHIENRIVYDNKFELLEDEAKEANEVNKNTDTCNQIPVDIKDLPF